LKPTTILDVEIFRNWFAVGMLDVGDGRVDFLELHDDQPLDVDRLRYVLDRNRLITFNGDGFDIPIIHYALAGATTQQLHDAAGAVINQNLRGWQLADRHGFKLGKPRDHVDLIEVAPGMASLKIYGGRMHSARLQDLPVDPNDEVSPTQRVVLKAYCENDLHTTRDLYETLKPQLELRRVMGQQYKIDLRSKSDAQIAEAVITSEVTEAVGTVLRPEIAPGTAYRYKAPDFLQFSTLPLQVKLGEILDAEFVVKDNGGITEPPALAGQTVTIGAGVYRLGIGGLHSSETCQSVVADEEHVLLDRDVASYYPSIILRLGLEPAQMAGGFLRVYQSIVDRRLKAKAAGDKVAADTLKIVVNGSFGKLGSKWSRLYSPDLMVQVTVTGQLCLLMLIEALEAEGIRVVSANTDGIVIHCHRGDVGEMERIVTDWEQRTGFVTEETSYRALYSRDVNNYIAIKPDGGVKVKGAFAPPGLMKNPNSEISTEAAIRWLRDHTPLAQTIQGCTDIRKFVVVRQVKGGAIDQDEKPIGKAVRWYYSTSVTGPLRYAVNGYTVPRSEGARPLMELPAEMPPDVDFAWYEQEAADILAAVGGFNGLV